MKKETWVLNIVSDNPLLKEITHLQLDYLMKKALRFIFVIILKKQQ